MGSAVAVWVSAAPGRCSWGAEHQTTAGPFGRDNEAGQEVPEWCAPTQAMFSAFYFSCQRVISEQDPQQSFSLIKEDLNVTAVKVPLLILKTFTRQVLSEVWVCPLQRPSVVFGDFGF